MQPDMLLQPVDSAAQRSIRNCSRFTSAPSPSADAAFQVPAPASDAVCADSIRSNRGLERPWPLLSSSLFYAPVIFCRHVCLVGLGAAAALSRRAESPRALHSLLATC